MAEARDGSSRKGTPGFVCACDDGHLLRRMNPSDRIPPPYAYAASSVDDDSRSQVLRRPCATGKHGTAEGLLMEGSATGDPAAVMVPRSRARHEGAVCIVALRDLAAERSSAKRNTLATKGHDGAGSRPGSHDVSSVDWTRRLSWGGRALGAQASIR